jgi:hypothetical protein
MVAMNRGEWVYIVYWAVMCYINSETGELR